MRNPLLLLGMFVCTCLLRQPCILQAQVPFDKEPRWIWATENAEQSAPGGSVYFRTTLSLPAGPEKAHFRITADNHFTLWINNTEVGSGDSWQNLSSFDVTKLLKAGKNVIAVEGKNEGVSPAGLIVELRVELPGKQRAYLLSDKSWKASLTAARGWQATTFDDAKWANAYDLAPFGEGPWGRLGQAIGGTAAKQRTFKVPAGFSVKQVLPSSVDLLIGKNAGKPSPYRLSLVNMCFDPLGRLLVSQEGGPILICSQPNEAGIYQRVIVYCDRVKNCQGMCWARDSLYLIGNGPKGVGLYRCRDTSNSDLIDSVELIAKFNGGMGEHGPHAVVHGPDDHLYVVVGNHSWLVVDKLASNSPLKRWPNGQQGPDQGKPGTTEDVLLPRQNDANGHAAGLRAPGGTIWRMKLDGREPALVAAGFRNPFDVAFNPMGEMFSFDSDMEWDENLPWYRPVRVCHVIPGADFGWRTGSSKIPAYAEDTTPPIFNTGRGSPTGVEVYDHVAFPAKYRGSLFICDWSIGVLWAIHLKPEGASYRAEAEKFCTGSPMPISDCAVGPDGAMYFTLGGRGTQGGVYRISYSGELEPGLRESVPQPLAPWSTLRKDEQKALPRQLLDNRRRRSAEEGRVLEVLLAGINGGPGSQAIIQRGLKDTDAMVRRHACEAAIRQELEIAPQELKPLLQDRDRSVRAAARLLLQRIDPTRWAETFLKDNSDSLARQTIISLCKINKAADYQAAIFQRLHLNAPPSAAPELLEWLRTVQLAMVHTQKRPDEVRGLAVDCREMFPHKDSFVNRELAILLAEFARTEVLKEGVVEKLLAQMRAIGNDKPQQIHYYYCLRVIKTGWKPEQKQALLAWYEGTRGWTGGASFTRYLENILRETTDIFTTEDRSKVFSQIETFPLSSLVLLRTSTPEQLPERKRLLEMYQHLNTQKWAGRVNEFREVLLDAIIKTGGADALADLRKLADASPAELLRVARILARFPSPENFPFLVRALEPATGNLVVELLEGLRNNPIKAKVDDGPAYRSVLMASRKLNENQRSKVVELLRYWSNGREFGAGKGDWKTELTSWSKWFSQAFPKEPPLPDLIAETIQPSKYKLEELLTYLNTDMRGKAGDAVRGKAAFEKAQCIKCHRYGNEGEGLGPDLSAVSKRFKRAEILEAIYLPSKVISDQYRSTRVTTFDGKTYDGLLAEMGNMVTILLSDGTKVMLRKDNIERRVASLTSVMPEKLLDGLTREEIADLFAFMEKEPNK